MLLCRGKRGTRSTLEMLVIVCLGLWDSLLLVKVLMLRMEALNLIVIGVGSLSKSQKIEGV